MDEGLKRSALVRIKEENEKKKVIAKEKDNVKQQNWMTSLSCFLFCLEDKTSGHARNHGERMVIGNSLRVLATN